MSTPIYASNCPDLTTTWIEVLGKVPKKFHSIISQLLVTRVEGIGPISNNSNSQSGAKQLGETSLPTDNQVDNDELKVLVEYIFDGLLSADPLEVSRPFLEYLAEKCMSRHTLPSRWAHLSLSDISPHSFVATENSDIMKAKIGETIVAVKFLRKRCDLACRNTRSAINASLLEEVLPWSGLNHPNILSLFGIANYPERGELGIVWTFQANGTLPDFIQSNPVIEKIYLLTKVAGAIVYLHSLPCPILHGDIKGINILVDDNGEPLLCDFGQAVVIRPGEFTTAKSGGTCRWAAPEILDPAGTIDLSPYPITASDVYSFASTILEITSGKRPFSYIAMEPRVALEVIVHHKHPRRPASEMAPELIDPLWHLMVTCWAFHPSERPSIEDVYHFMTHM